MEVITKIRKLGNEYGILFPDSLMSDFYFKSGDEFFIEVEDEKIILTLNKKQHKTLSERFSTFKEETKQEEYWTEDLFEEVLDIL